MELRLTIDNIWQRRAWNGRKQFWEWIRIKLTALEQPCLEITKLKVLLLLGEGSFCLLHDSQQVKRQELRQGKRLYSESQQAEKTANYCPKEPSWESTEFTLLLCQGKERDWFEVVRRWLMTADIWTSAKIEEGMVILQTQSWGSYKSLFLYITSLFPWGGSFEQGGCFNNFLAVG